MTTTEIKAAICTYFNSTAPLGVPVIQAPVNAQAPAGTYIAVAVSSVAQHGNGIHATAPGGSVPSAFENEATLTFTEVEGTGDALRELRNGIQRRAFREAAWTAGFTVWTVGAMQEIRTFDGDFVVPQWRLQVAVNFEDRAAFAVGKIETVDFDVEPSGISDSN